MITINNGNNGFSFWTHYPLDDLDSEKIVRRITEFNNQLNMNVIKTMPNGLFAIEDWISGKADFSEIQKGGVAKIKKTSDEELIKMVLSKEISVREGAYKRELESIKNLRTSISNEVEIICTVFNPLTLLKKMFPDNLVELVNSDQKRDVKKIIDKILVITKEYIKEACAIGCSGFFFANQAIDYYYRHSDIYNEYGLNLEREIIDYIHQQNKYVVLHLHGQIKSIEIFKEFDVEAYSWHIDESNVSIEQFHNEMGESKVIFGGLSRRFITEGKVSNVINQVDNFLRSNYNRQIIFAPECVIRHPLKMNTLELISRYIKERMNQQSNANQIGSSPHA